MESYELAPGAHNDPMHEWAILDTEQGTILGYWINQEAAEEYVSELGGDRDRYVVTRR